MNEYWSVQVWSAIPIVYSFGLAATAARGRRRDKTEIHNKSQIQGRWWPLTQTQAKTQTQIPKHNDQRWKYDTCIKHNRGTNLDTNTDIKNIKQDAASGKMIVLQEYLVNPPFRPPIFFFLINYLNPEELNAVKFFFNQHHHYQWQ